MCCRLKNLNLKFTLILLSAYLWEMEILTKLFHYPLPQRIFSEKKQRYIHNDDNDDADNNDNDDASSRLHLPVHRLEK